MPATWFQSDDFAWLGLASGVRNGRGLIEALFTPYAQGTVRVVSERLFFVVFLNMFGLHPTPYRIWTLATWALLLVLVSLVGARVAGSRVAGTVAALICAANTNAVIAVAWSSAYNQILCGVALLAGFYARLRWTDLEDRGRACGRWRIAEWCFYMLGFGALELAVVYPLLAALHAAFVDRKRLRGTLLLAARRRFRGNPLFLYT
ncbi:MAG: hypothetical protein JO062_18485 [Bryobacterales bacterium]|nr:hypothetical protein [Bryobacterales bacterium]